MPPHSLPSRTAYTRNILGGSPTPQGPPSSFGPGGIEDLGYKKVTPGQFQASLVQTVESLLQSKLSQAASTSQRKTVTKVSGSEGQLQRDISLPTMVDDLVLYTQPQDENDQKPGLGAVQPKGRAEVMQQWLRPDLPQASLRPERRDPIPRALQLRSSQAQDAEMEWSSLSDASRQAIRQWVAGQLGGRHCMLVLEQGCAETSVPPTSETSLQPDLRGGAVLNVLSGLFAEGGLLNPQGLGSWLFQAVFSKHPQQVLEEALEQCILEIDDPRLERLADISPEQVNLALRRLLLKAQFRSCSPLSCLEGPGSQDECTKLQVWLELARLHVEGWPGVAGAPASKERPQRAPSDKAFGDGGVLKELGKQEIELEAESQQMSLETLRAQNRLIEEYVMRLVRQRDELKQVTKLAEERDSYYILGLNGPSVSEEEVKKAYRNLARKEHPDKAGIGNKKRFQAIQQAYTSILKQRQLGGPAVAEEVRDEAPKEVVSAILNESYNYGMQAQEAADCVAVGAHRAMRVWEDSEGKRRSLRGLRELTRQSAVELRGLGQQLRLLGRATNATVRCAEAFLNDTNDIAESLSTGMALRDRCAIVEDAGSACTTSAELLERISEATEATLKKVEKAAPDASDGNNLQRLGTRLLTESLARSSSVARRTAEEAISCASKALDLHKGLMMLDAEARKERERLRKRQQSPEDEPVPAADVERPKEKPSSTGHKESKETKKPEEPPRTPRPITPAMQTPRDQLKSAAKRVKERHVSLRVKNLRFLASLNEEALRTQARLFALLERSEGALLPEISVSQKGVIFDLVAQLLDFALAEAGKLAGNLSTAPARIMERVMSFALALEHGKELAMPVDSRTQALKLASLIDTQLLCQVVTGPFRRRLLALARRRCEGGCNRRSSSGPMKAWEEAANACCERIACCIQQAMVQNGDARGRGT